MTNQICEIHGTPLFYDKNMNAWCPDCLKGIVEMTSSYYPQLHHGFSTKHFTEEK